jgi:hypothetical protein
MCVELCCDGLLRGKRIGTLMLCDLRFIVVCVAHDLMCYQPLRHTFVFDTVVGVI